MPRGPAPAGRTWRLCRAKSLHSRRILTSGCSTVDFSPPIARVERVGYCRHMRGFSPYKASGRVLARRRWSGWRSRLQCARPRSARAWHRAVWLGGHDRAVPFPTMSLPGLPPGTLTGGVRVWRDIAMAVGAAPAVRTAPNPWPGGGRRARVRAGGVVRRSRGRGRGVSGFSLIRDPGLRGSGRWGSGRRRWARMRV